MRIAIEGCGHGTLHAIYASIKKSCEVNGWNGIDLLIIGGDFQAVRNAHDLNTMSVPVKYRSIGDFHEYYRGKRIAPYLTIFVGGNHEASSHLQELFYGGWVAKNIYYLGAANVVRFGGLRIAGLSGIWKGYNYNKPHFERLPYNTDEIKSLYHVRELDVRKLLLVRTQVDIGISHDWPRGIEWQGDYKALFRQKDLFEADAAAGTLGSSAARYVLDRLRPPHWFSAHLHCKYAARIVHSDEEVSIPEPDMISETPVDKNAIIVKNANEIDLELDGETFEQPDPSDLRKNDDEIDLDIGDVGNPEMSPPSIGDSVAERSLSNLKTPFVPSDLRAQLPAAFSRPAQRQTMQPPPAPPPPLITNKSTEFLALDKCLPSRRFLQILEVEPHSVKEKSEELPKLAYDAEWLSILRVFGTYDPHLLSPPNLGECAYIPLIQAQTDWVEENLVKSNRMLVPDNFQPTAPFHDGGDVRTVGRMQPKEYTNSQTKAFCELLDITNWFDSSKGEREERVRTKSIEIEADSRVREGGNRRGRGGGSTRGSSRGFPRGNRGGRGRGNGRYHG